MQGPHYEETPGNVARPPRPLIPPKAGPRFHSKLMIAAVLTVALVAGGALFGYGITQMRQGEQRDAAAEIARQREADQRVAQQQAEQSQAAAQASQEATIAEGVLVSAHVTNLKAMRAELASTMDALKKKAKSSAAASREWDRLWEKRQASYRSRSSAVRAHNYRERQRYYAGKVERANSAGKLVIKYTYRPRYQASPARPEKPAPLSVSAAPEIKRLSVLQNQIDALWAAVGVESPAARAFGSVYPALTNTAQALRSTVGDARKMARAVVVTKGAKGKVIDAAKISKVNQAALEGPFGELDQSFSAALTAVGLTPEQVAAASALTQ